MGAKTTKDIAEWVCRSGYQDFNQELVDYTKNMALSHLGMTVAGSTMPFGKIALEYVKGQNCPAEAGVLGGGFQTLAEYAALANGSLSHTTELEDDSFPEGLYSCGSWPTVFAMGEKLDLSGKEVIEAYVLGYEVGARIGVASEKAIADGYLNAAGCSTIGSAAMAAKLLKLNVAKTTHALSIAASQASGIARQTGAGAHLIEAGFAGRNGICAATLAKRGFTGNPTILEGEGGFMDLWAGQPEFDLPLGEGYRVDEIGIKKYPCCYLMQRNIDGVLELIEKHDISWDEVESIEHEINHTVSLYLKYPQPETGEDARFSLPHSTVACFFDQKVFLDSYTDAKAQDPKFKKAREKVKVNVHSDWKSGYFTFQSPVTIRLHDGTKYEKVCVEAKGDPSRRLNTDEVIQKYLDCIEFAGIFNRETAEIAADMTLSLDSLDNVSELVSTLTFPDK
jgi:2-methylcitrate dehydratase PrpD|tara:strand:- start:5069 stop:6421 length:1353 start_codon:yes stop_codon:yes gene_type:complete